MNYWASVSHVTTILDVKFLMTSFWNHQRVSCRQSWQMGVTFTTDLSLRYKDQLDVMNSGKLFSFSKFGVTLLKAWCMGDHLRFLVIMVLDQQLSSLNRTEKVESLVNEAAHTWSVVKLLCAHCAFVLLCGELRHSTRCALDVGFPTECCTQS